MTPRVELRPMEEAGLDALFEHMRDPESVRMAAFVAADPDDRTAFDAHMSDVLAMPDVVIRAEFYDWMYAGNR